MALLPKNLFVDKFEILETLDNDNKNFRNRQSLIGDLLDDFVKNSVEILNKDSIHENLSSLQKAYEQSTLSTIREIKKNTTKGPSSRANSDATSARNTQQLEEEISSKRVRIDYVREINDIASRMDFTNLSQKALGNFYTDPSVKEEEAAENEEKTENRAELSQIKSKGKKKQEVIEVSDNTGGEMEEEEEPKPGKKGRKAKGNEKGPAGRGNKNNKKTKNSDGGLQMNVHKRCGSSDDEQKAEDFNFFEPKKRTFDKNEIKEENVSEEDEEFNIGVKKSIRNTSSGESIDFGV